MPQLSWENAKKKHPQVFNEMFRQFNASDDETFKKAYKASTDAEKKTIDEVLAEKNLHLMMRNGRIMLMEEKLLPNQDVLVSQVVQDELISQKAFEPDKPITKDFLKVVYKIIEKVMGKFLNVVGTIGSGLGSYLARHSPYEFAKAGCLIAVTTIVIQAYYSTINFVTNAGQCTVDFVKEVFGMEGKQVETKKEKDKEDVKVEDVTDDYKNPRISYEKKTETSKPTVSYEKKKETVEQIPQLKPTYTNPFTESAKIASNSVEKATEKISDTVLMATFTTVFAVVVLTVSKQYFAHQRYLIEHSVKERTLPKRDEVRPEEAHFHPEVQTNARAVSVTHQPVHHQRNVTQREIRKAQLRAETLQLLQEIRERNS